MIALVLAAWCAASLDADPSFAEGRRLYAALDYEGAIASFQKGLAVPGRTDEDAATLHAWIGLTHAQSGDEVKARASFDTAVAFDALVTLPADAPPKVRDWLDQARARRRGTLPTTGPSWVPPLTSPVVVGAVQWLTGFSIVAITMPCNCCTLGVFGCTVQPALIGYAETFVADWFGPARAPAVWPMAAAIGAGVASTAATYATIIAMIVALNAVPQLAQVAGSATIAPAGISLLFSAIFMTAVPIAYWIVAEPKKEGDVGTGWPGLMEPAGPPAPAPTTTTPTTTSATKAMRY